MKKTACLILALTVIASLLCPLQASALEKTEAKAKSTPPPGVGIAKTLSEVTGVAISPLLGVGAVGAYQFSKAKTDEERAKLPWFANPWFFIPALVIVGLCFLKDTAGTALPTALKKPLDVIDSIEHKISGLVATGAFVPIAVSIMNEANSPGTGSSFSSMGFAAMDFHWLYNIIMVPIFMIVFIMVFLASNAINILILLSPFTTVDTALKAFRTSILASVLVSSQINPWVGAAWAALIVIISYFIAGWSFRLTHFGVVFIWEFVTMRRKRFTPDAKVNKIFLSRKINKVPARTYGKLFRDDKGNLVVDYHPWLVLPKRTLTLPEGQYEVGHGLVYSEILRVEDDRARTMILLPPRYRGHEDQMVKVLSLAGSREVGIRAAWTWLKSMFGGGAKTATA
jgi:hypothetical protein